MIRDSQTSLWEAAALTASAVSTNCYDLGAGYSGGTANGAARDPSVGIPEGIIITVGVAADHTTGNETYEFDIITATASDLTTGQLIVSQHVILFSDLTLGARYWLPIDAGRVTQRYLGASYVGGGTTPTITVTAWIASYYEFEKHKYYTSAIVVN